MKILRGAEALTVAYAVPAYLLLSFSPTPYYLSFIPLLASGVLLGMRGPSLRWNMGNAFIAIFVVSFLVSVMASANIAQSIRGAVILLPGLLLFFAARLQLADKNVADNLYLGFLWAMVIISARVLWNWYLEPEAIPADYFRSFGSETLVVPNDCLILVILAPFAMATLARSQGVLSRVLALVALLMSGMTIYLIESRVCAIGIVLSAVFYLLLHKPRALLPVGVVTVLVLLSAETYWDFPLSRNFAAMWEQNTRLSVWWIALQGFLNAPILGQGPATFGSIYNEYSAELVRLEWMKIDGRAIPWVHNIFLEALVERGIVGFTALIGLLAYLTAQSRNTYKHHYGDAVLVAITMFLFAGMFELTMERVWVVSMLFLFAAMVNHSVEEG